MPDREHDAAPAPRAEQDADRTGRFSPAPAPVSLILLLFQKIQNLTLPEACNSGPGSLLSNAETLQVKFQAPQKFTLRNKRVLSLYPPRKKIMIIIKHNQTKIKMDNGPGCRVNACRDSSMAKFPE